MCNCTRHKNSVGCGQPSGLESDAKNITLTGLVQLSYITILPSISCDIWTKPASVIFFASTLDLMSDYNRPNFYVVCNYT